jgi:Tfp pilus assembly major pilin PilA
MYHQRGVSLIGWLIILVFIGFAALIGIRVVPVYVEAYTVKSVLNGLQSDSGLSGSDRNAVLQSLMKRLDINDVKSVKRENIKFESGSGGLEVLVDYETRFPLVANIDGLAQFTQRAIIRH